MIEFDMKKMKVDIGECRYWSDDKSHSDPGQVSDGVGYVASICSKCRLSGTMTENTAV